ncbi:ABC transporter ATP-binding protein [Aestuariivirga sp.]|uniref:ABC transporter ATP-binding protein n=1 Tax=Aestuariivirga sp. TaxID=2650926 RepID=UPI0039E4CC73
MSSPAADLQNVTLRYGNFTAVKDVSLSIAKGSFVTLLGPSGCGKTTILRSLAGLVTPTSGEIHIAGKRVNDVPIHQRNIGLVFQNYALFPHKTIFDNVAFGLKYRSVPKDQIAAKVKRALEIVRLPGVEKKLPSELSGGQQQRIALARAIVIEPHVLLLDEPLSALDANLREEMRIEIKTIQREVGITTLFVTHDQEEALAMSDVIVVMNHGVVEQMGSPEEVYNSPATRFVASFLGQSNLLDGTVTETAPGRATVAVDGGPKIEVAAPKSMKAGDKVTVIVRAQKITVGGTGGNVLPARIAATAYLGGTASYVLDVGKLKLQAINPIAGKVYREGEDVKISFAPGDTVLLDKDGKRIG